MIETINVKDVETLREDGKKVIPIGKPFEQDGKKMQKAQIHKRGFRHTNVLVVLN